MLGQWTFRIATSAMPVLTALEIQLQQRTFDFYALAAAAVGSAIVAIMHAGRASGEKPGGAQ